ncbi:hypothetical protein, partial [Georgenia daeguensis]|uniref:hypothetical protein n=1 Tax=Georgenia daeguensis TaxID=908355 RepID=UPI0031E608AC
ARQDLALDLLIPEDLEGPGGPGVSRLAGARTSTTGTGARTSTTGHTVPGRKVVLNVHLTDTSRLDDPNPFANPVGRWEEGRCPISTAQIREWLRAKDTTIIVRPVIDLADHVPSTPTRSPTDTRPASPCATTAAGSRTAPDPHNAATSTTTAPTARVA